MRGEGRAAYRLRELARGLRERASAVTLLESCARRERRLAAAAKGGQRLVFPSSKAGLRISCCSGISTAGSGLRYTARTLSFGAREASRVRVRSDATLCPGVASAWAPGRPPRCTRRCVDCLPHAHSPLRL